MPLPQQIKRSLRNADMALDPDNHHLALLRPQRIEGLAQLGHEHGEGRFVHVRLRLHAIVTVQAELGTRLAELGAQLRCREDGNREDLRGAQQLLRRRDDFGELVDGRAEFLLQVADAFWGKISWAGRERAGTPGCLAREGRTRVLGALQGASVQVVGWRGGCGGHCVQRRRAGAAIVGCALGVMLERRLQGCECEIATIWYITYGIRAVVEGQHQCMT